MAFQKGNSGTIVLDLLRRIDQLQRIGRVGQGDPGRLVQQYRHRHGGRERGLRQQHHLLFRRDPITGFLDRLAVDLHPAAFDINLRLATRACHLIGDMFGQAYGFSHESRRW